MIAIKKITVSLFLLLLVQLSLAQNVTLKSINSIAKKQFVAELNKNTKQYSFDKADISDENFRFDRRIKTRNKVLDSLNILSTQKKIIIIDEAGNVEGRFFEVSYLIYGNKILEVTYGINSKNNTKYYVREITEYDLKKNDSNDILAIYKYFNVDKFSEIGTKVPIDLKDRFESYYVTSITNNKFGYYMVDAHTGYKVFKYN